MAGMGGWRVGVLIPGCPQPSHRGCLALVTRPLSLSFRPSVLKSSPLPQISPFSNSIQTFANSPLLNLPSVTSLDRAICISRFLVILGA